MNTNQMHAEITAVNAKIADLRASLDGEAHDAAHLDTRQLSQPPRPWSEDDYQRDLRRAQRSGEGDLPRDLWLAAAEDGRDAVIELRRERIEREITELEHYRGQLQGNIEFADIQGHDAAVAARRAEAEEPAKPAFTRFA